MASLHQNELRYLKSQSTEMFVQQFIQANN